MYAVDLNDLEKLLESAVKLTVHETIAELRKSGLLSTPDKMAYKIAAQEVQAYYTAIKNGEKHNEAIEDAVRSLIHDDYYNVLPLYYYEGKTIESIAEVYDCDPCTITRNKKRLCLEVYRKTLQK